MIVHVYAENKAGKMIILQANTFSVQSPKAGNVEITSKDINKGTFTVKVSGITNSSAVREVLVPVWCAADQSDINGTQLRDRVMEAMKQKSTLKITSIMQELILHIFISRISQEI